MSNDSCPSPPAGSSSLPQAAPTSTATSKAITIRVLFMTPPSSADSLPLPCLPFQLVHVHGQDQYRANRHLLPEWLEPQNDESVLQCGRDENAHHGSPYPSDTAEKARSADHHRSDRLEIVGSVSFDRRRCESSQRQIPGEPREQARNRIHADQVTRHVDPGSAGSLRVRPHRIRVATETGERQ